MVNAEQADAHICVRVMRIRRDATRPLLDARETMPWETPGGRAYMHRPERTGYGDACIQTRAGECSL